MSHNETIVVDYDDTLALTLNRDWENAVPNIELIEKLNQLFDDGWAIHIVTARGQLSCEGDHEKADLKYRSQIEAWLLKHGVKYTSLSFQKKLAAYYIDDKGITPESFVKKFERTPLKGGWSGAKVYYDKLTDSVYKTATNTHAAVAWYKKAAEYRLPTPKIHTVVGDTIRMNRLPEYCGEVADVLDLLYDYSKYPPIYPDVTPESYVDRCVSRIKSCHLSESQRDKLKSVLSEAMKYTPATFSHGDASVSNVMGSINCIAVPCMIDPISDPTLYSSYIIDIAKLYASIDISEQEHVFRSYTPSATKGIIETSALADEKFLFVLLAHELGHLCRVLPYSPDRERIVSLISKKLSVIDQYIL